MTSLRQSLQTPSRDVGDGGVGRAPDVAVTLPAAPASVSIARQALIGLLDERVPEPELRDIILAVSEATTNAVQHGAGGREPERIIVRAWADDNAATIAVSDDGEGISPRLSEESVGLGLGLPIIISLADDVSFSKQRGTFVVTMRFWLEEATAT